jgi:phosphorylcholine metabolism protein LicD
MNNYINRQIEKLNKDFIEITQILQSLKLPYFIDAGTLLKIYRDKGFAHNDMDIDFGVFRKTFTIEIQDELKKVLLQNGYEFKNYECRKFLQSLEPNFIPYVLKFKGKHSQKNIDFHVFEELENEYYHRGWLGYFHFPKDLLNTLDTIEFLNLKIPTPHNPEQYLRLHYGETWNINIHSVKKPQCYPNWTKEL